VHGLEYLVGDGLGLDKRDEEELAVAFLAAGTAPWNPSKENWTATAASTLSLF
jgi:hypothetical protein